MNFLTDEQLERLLEKLITLSRSGKLDWQTEGGRSTPTSFACTQGDFWYRVQTSDGDEYAPFDFEVHRAGTGTRSPLVFVATSTDTAFAEAVADLYQAAQRKALGVEGLAEDIFGSLDALDDN